MANRYWVGDINISNTTYDSSTSIQSGTSRSVFFKPDGTKMYVTYADSTVKQYSLSTAWDSSTATYDSVYFDVSGEETQPTGIFFSPDGLEMYINGYITDHVQQYSLSNAWDVSTASHTSSFDTTAQVSSTPNGIQFSSDGTKMYVGNKTNVDADAIYQYTLSTAWDISTASYASKSLSVSAQTSSSLQSFYIDPSGTKLVISSQSSSDYLYQYTLSTAWDLSTGSYASIFKDVGSQDAYPNGVFISPTKDRLYFIGGVSNNIYEYSMHSSGTWNSTNNWSDSSGGFGGASVPTSSDDVFFDSNSGSGTVTFSETAYAKTLDMSDSSIKTLAGSGSIFVYGSLYLASDITDNRTATNTYIWGDNVATVDTQGVVLATDLNLNSHFNSPITVKTVNLASTLNIASGKKLVVAKGTLNTNNYNMTVGKIEAIVQLGDDRGINFGSSYVNVTGTGSVLNFDSSGLTITAGTSTIEVSDTSVTQKTVALAGKTYNNIIFSGDNIDSNNDDTFSKMTITGDNMFIGGSPTIGTLELNNAGEPTGLIVEPAEVITITTTVTTNASSGNLSILSCGSPGEPFTISKSSGIVELDYMDITDSEATGGALWFAGSNSIDGGGNSGWIFESLNTVDITKSSSYTVVSDSAITKSASYSLVLQTGITKGSSYEVREFENLNSSNLKKLKIGKSYGPVTSVVLGRVPQNDNVVISSSVAENNTISSIDTGTNLFTVTGHALSDGNIIRITSDGTLPEPLKENTNYYVYTNGDLNTFALAKTYTSAVAGVPLIDLQTSGSGTITITNIETQEVQINNNQIVDDDRQDLLPPIYEQLVGIEWNEVDATTVGLGWHEVGDVVRFTQGSQTVQGFISEIHLVLDGGVKETLKSTIPDVASIDYQTAGGVIKTLYNTEIKVDKQENDITSIVEQQVVYEDSVEENFTQLYQDLDSLDLTIQRSGGGNLIRNSVGFATERDEDFSSVAYDKLSFWDYNANYDIATDGAVSSYSSSESQNAGATSGEVISMIGNDVSITQRVNVAANTELSFGVRVNNPIGAGEATITLSNDNETHTISIDDTTAHEWEEFLIENFTSTLSWLDVKIEVANTTDFEFTDLRLLYGSTTQGWVQARSEILSTNVQFTELGMRIFDDVHDTTTQVTYNEFSTRRKSDDLVLFEADDTGVVTNDLTIKGETSYTDDSGTVIKQITIPASSNLAGIAFIKGS